MSVKSVGFLLDWTIAKRDYFHPDISAYLAVHGVKTHILGIYVLVRSWH